MRCDHFTHSGASDVDVPTATGMILTVRDGAEILHAYCAPHQRLAASDAVILNIPYAQVTLPEGA